MYAEVAVDTGATNLDFFTYLIPEHIRDQVALGCCVLVPLGTRQHVGFVVGLTETTEIERLREILAVVTAPAALTPELLTLTQWISSNWLCGLQRTLRTIIPRVLNHRVRVQLDLIDTKAPSLPSLVRVFDALTELGGSATLDALKAKIPAGSVTRAITELERQGVIRRTYVLDLPKVKPRMVKGVTLAVDHDYALAVIDDLTEKQARVLRMCLPGRPIELGEVIRRSAAGRGVVSALERKGLLMMTEITRARAPAYTHEDYQRVCLTEEQSQALETIRSPLLRVEHETILVHGVTASGKTEVYLRAIEQTLEQGRTCLVLVPEISLTTQVMDIFKSRFGDLVAVLHSSLGSGERHDEWMRVQSGVARVVLGPRSALFAPLKDLGLTVVDEEHESTFKQESEPRYHARDTAIKRSCDSGAVVLLGSATPAVESYYRALHGEYRLVELKNRVAGRPLPDVEIADLREEYHKGTPTIFTAALKETIAERIAAGQQVILFQNRRAYSTLLLCRECGYVAKCPNCAVSLKLHSAERLMKCHYCAYEKPAPTVCPNCSGRRIGRFGIGTERVEEETKAAFPNARVLRMDKDTTALKGSHSRILGAFRRREADILVGTQMIAKGLDFPKVTLVGVISADTSLNMPDFRASERTFQLLSQVAGRAGRGSDAGKVIIQTFNPEHYALQCAVTHDYQEMYRTEIAAREELGYPPFSSLINMISNDESESTARAKTQAIADRLMLSGKRPFEVLGPCPAPLAKLRGHYRWHLVLKTSEREETLAILRSVFAAEPNLRRGLAVDVDPVTML